MSGKTWIRFILVAAVAAIPVIISSKVFPTGEIEAGAPRESFTSHLDERIPDIMHDYEIPGLSIALIRDGRPVWKQAYGYADLETGRKMTVDTYCRMESISKSVTAWGVMKLIERGKIDLDAPVETYLGSWRLPESPYNESEVSVRRLLNGSAGMPLGTIGNIYPPGAEDIPDLREVLGRDAVLFQEPGSSFYYSNAGFNVLELMIEEVSGRPFAEYMREEVLLPLDMEDASFTWGENLQPPVAHGYDGMGKPISPYVYPYDAAGDLLGTIDDVAAFVSAGMTDFNSASVGVLEAGTIDEMYSLMSEMTGYYRVAADGYGLGHFIENFPAGTAAEGGGQDLRVVFHGGQGSGWMTDFHSVPETGDGIVILSNSQRTWPGFAYILTDWAVWTGLPSIGMGGIASVQKIAWIFVAVVFALILRGLLLLIEGFARKERRFAPLAGDYRLLRSIELLFALLLIGLFLWVFSLDYWFIDSVLPIASTWLTFIDLAGGLMLLASALCPKRQRDNSNTRLPGGNAEEKQTG